jgi:putative N6-adenine-specific DNA methylase
MTISYSEKDKPEIYSITAKTFSGLEQVLAGEIKKIGGTNIKPGLRAVFYRGDLGIIYKSNYYLRTALRILKEITTFRFRDVSQFYTYCKEAPWHKYLSSDQNFMVTSTVSDSNDFRNTMFASLKVKDAIADHFREATGKRPDVNTSDPHIIIDVHINKNYCTLSLDSSGESLHKRGYRSIQGEAPLNEVLAAGMILLSGWKGKTDFIDPMCGSGTLPVEAALIAQNIPPGKYRKKYSFENWPDFDKKLFEIIKNKQPSGTFTNKIYASDISGTNILKAKSNARYARVFPRISFRTCDMKDLNISTKGATIIINPPYGERMKYQNLDEIYKMTGERLKHKFAGNSAWILTTTPERLRFIGLKPAKKITLYNGALKCIYAHYPLFEGKKRYHLSDKISEK